MEEPTMEGSTTLNQKEDPTGQCRVHLYRLIQN